MQAKKHGNEKHGHRGTLPTDRSPTYNSWRKARERVYNPNHIGYKYYGGKGVTMCSRWDDFEKFLFDMGERPEDTTIDRIDPAGNYEPDNCRWATRQVQANNKVRNKSKQYITVRLDLAPIVEALKAA